MCDIFRVGLVAFTLLMLAVTQAHAAPPLIAYQGILNGQGGTPVNGAVSVVFSIYDVDSGGTALWTESRSLQVTDGKFDIFLGSVTALNAAVFSASDRFLGIKVASDPEMAPRQRIATSAFSFSSEGTPPVGAIIAWHKSFPNTPSLPYGWLECNGQQIADPDSAFDGQVLPNLNGGRFLRGDTASGATSGSDTHRHQWAQIRFAGTQEGTHFSGNNGQGNGYQGSFDSSGVRQDFALGPGPVIYGDWFTSTESSVPPSFHIVWIMRVK